MKHISYLHKKIAAERDSKSLKKIYVDKAKPTAEESMGPSPTGLEETRRQYFERLNNYIFDNTETFDALSPFGIDGINFVHTIPEDSLASMPKGERLNFVKWIAQNYDGNKNIFTIQNCIQLKSFIDVSPTYNFDSISMHSPSDIFLEMKSKEELSKETPEINLNEALGNLGLDSEIFLNAKGILSKDNYPDIDDILSKEEQLFLAAGAALTDGLNNISLIMDFIVSANSDIEIGKPGDLKALYSFDIRDGKSISSSFSSLNDNQSDWHERSAEEQESADSSDGIYGYGYKTNIIKYTFEDGWKVVYLPSKDDPNMIPWDEDNSLSHDRIQEGDNNSLCLGSSSKYYNDNKEGSIYSLRDPSNKPIATIRMDWSGAKVHDNYSEVRIREIRESKNRDVGIESSLHLAEFFDHFGIPDWIYESYVVDFSENTLSAQIRRKDPKIFDWINFLNKNRGTGKYSQYNKFYDELVNARGELFEDTDGRFINKSSIEKDPRRVRLYISKVFSNIILTGKTDESIESFVNNLFLKNSYYGAEELWKIIELIPNYSKALDVMGESYPKITWYAMKTKANSLRDRVWAQDLSLKIAKILLRSGREELIESVLNHAGQSGYGAKFFKLNDISDECNDPSIILYLEQVYDKDWEKFDKSEFYIVYHGDRDDIIEFTTEAFSKIVSGDIAKIKESKYDYSFKDKTIYALKRLGGKIPENEADELMSWAIKGIDSEKSEHTEKNDKSNFSPSKKYVEAFLLANGSLPDDSSDLTGVGGVDLFTRYFIKSIIEGSTYRDIERSSRKSLSLLDSIALSGPKKDEVLSSLVHHMKSIYDIEYKSDSPNASHDDVRFLYSKRFLFRFANDLYDQEGGISDLREIVNEGDITEFDIRKHLDSNDFYIDYIFSQKTHLHPAASNIKGELILSFFEYKIDSSLYGNRVESAKLSGESVIEKISGTPFSKEELRRLCLSISDLADSRIKELNKEISDGLEAESGGGTDVVRLLERYTMYSNMLGKMNKSKKLAQANLSEKIRELADAYKKIRQLFLKSPEAYFSAIAEGSDATIGSDKEEVRGMAVSLIKDLVSRHFRYTVRGEQVVEEVLSAMGLTSTAKALGIFLVKNGFLEEFEKLCYTTPYNQRK